MYKGPYEYPHYYIGLSTDTKPTVEIGDEFYETNTGAYYIFDGTTWNAKPSSNITPASGTGITINYLGAPTRKVYKVTTVFGAYTAAGTTKGIVIATLPAKTKLVAFYADTTIKYVGGTINAATLEVGVTVEGAAQIIAPHDVYTNPILKGLADADMGTSMTRAAAIQGGLLSSWTTTTAIYATIDATAGNTSVLTQGSTTFYLVTEQMV